MRLILIALLFLTGCGSSVSNWFDQWGDYALTQVASSMTETNLTEEEREDLSYLFEDIYSAKSCSSIQSYIHDNKVLLFFEENLDLPEGFLFDEFINFEYKKALFSSDNRPAFKVAFSVVSVWKSYYSLEAIEYVIERVRKCYPSKYLV